MSKTLTKPPRSVPGFRNKIQRFFEALEGLDEGYPERLERRVSHLESQVARLVAADKATPAARR